MNLIQSQSGSEMFELIIELFGNLSKHLSTLLDGFHPITDDYGMIERMSGRNYGKQYIGPFVLTLYLSGDTLFYLYTVGYDPEHPVLYHHIIMNFMPVFFRIQGDVMYCFAFTLTLTVYYQLIFDRMQHLKFIMFLSPNKGGNYYSFANKEIDRLLSERMARFHEKSKRKLKYWSQFMEFQVNMAFTFPLVGFEVYRVLFVENYHTKMRYWFCATLSLAFLHYFMTVVQMGVYFIVTNHLLNIKQRYYLELLSKLTPLNSYYHYNAMLSRILLHTNEINSFNRFYSKYITTIIVCYGIIGCSVLNAAQSHAADNVPMVLLLPWILFSMMYLIGIVLFSAASSKTIRLNKTIFVRLRSFQRALCHYRFIRSARRLVHLDLVNEYKLLLLQTCFRLITSSPLNNKLFFFQIFGIVSVIYLKTISR